MQREDLLRLDEEKKAMEAEIDAIVAYLTGPESGHIGLTGESHSAEQGYGGKKGRKK